MTDGSGFCVISGSLEEDPAELGVNASLVPLRESVGVVVVADLGEEGVLLISGRPRRPRLSGGPAEMG